VNAIGVAQGAIGTSANNQREATCGFLLREWIVLRCSQGILHFGNDGNAAVWRLPSEQSLAKDSQFLRPEREPGQFGEQHPLRRACTRLFRTRVRHRLRRCGVMKNFQALAMTAPGRIWSSGLHMPGNDPLTDKSNVPYAHRDTGFLQGLASGTLAQRFVRIQAAARERPGKVVSSQAANSQSLTNAHDQSPHCLHPRPCGSRGTP
jgi:hypothetical protein